MAAGADPVSIGASAGIQGATSIIAGILQYQATEDNIKAQSAIAEQERTDTLNQNNVSNTLNQNKFNLSEQGQQFNQAETKTKDKQDAIVQAYNRGQQLLQNQTGLNQSRAAPFLRNK